MFKIRKKDRVRVISGKDKSKEGEVLKVLKGEGKVLVSGINLASRHIKPREGRPGGIVKSERALAISKVALLCPSCQKMTRAGFRIENDKKTRFCKECQGLL